VSGEVYEHSIKLLRRFVSEEELPELTVENIEGVLRKLDSGERQTLPNPPASTTALPAPSDPAGDAAGLVQAGGEAVGGGDVMEADEHPLLQEELGCMLLDSKGKYRTCIDTYISTVWQ
jgi:hypothetical protein